MAEGAAAKGLALKDFQDEGVAWLLQNYERGMNSILADEMGVGKTPQAVTFTEHFVAR